jgi:hypothetical protein
MTKRPALSSIPLAILATALLTAAGCSNNEAPTAPTAPLAPAFSCVRHIYNDSDCRWTFSVPDETRRDGNVYFSDYVCVQDGKRTIVPTNCSNFPNGPCTVPPKCSVAIQYTYSGGYTGGVWHVQDQNGKVEKWVYDTRARLNECPYIHHNGSTGAVYLNEPADGDMTAGGCTF